MKLQFNKESLFALQNKLYEMGDETLEIESDHIQHNFMGWMNQHFELSEIYHQFFESMNQQEKLILALDTSFAIENRIPITLNNKKLIITDRIFCLHPDDGMVKYTGIVNYVGCGILLLNIPEDY